MEINCRNMLLMTLLGFGFCPLTLEVTFKEALDWTLQLKGKIDTFCRIYPEVCELCQDMLTYPCLWEDLSQGVKAVVLFNDYKNRKLTKNEFRKSLCKFTSYSTGCYIGYYAGANVGARAGGFVGSYLGDICCEWYFQDIYTTSMKVYTQALIDTRTSDKRFKNVNSNYEIIGENTANYVETFIPVADLLQRVKRIYDDVGADRKLKIIRLGVAVIHAVKGDEINLDDLLILM